MATSLQVTRSARLILAHRNDNKGKDYENDLFLPFGKGLSPSHLTVNAHQVEIHPNDDLCGCKKFLCSSCHNPICTYEFPEDLKLPERSDGNSENCVKKVHSFSIFIDLLGKLVGLMI